MKIFLYVKQHQKTGLKYFGKTIRKDPYTYFGSGKYWNNHLKTHGYDVNTLHVWEFENIKQCKHFALKFSIENKIVESNLWANLVEETGEGGWPSKWPVGSRNGTKNPFFGKTHSDKVRRRLSDVHKGKIISLEMRAKLSKILTGRPKANTKNYSKSMKERAKNPNDPSMVALRESRSDDWIVCNPQGNHIQIHSLRKFCNENSLNVKSLMSTRKTKQPLSRGSSKGWQLIQKL